MCSLIHCLFDAIVEVTCPDSDLLKRLKTFLLVEIKVLTLSKSTDKNKDVQNQNKTCTFVGQHGVGS